MIKLPLLQFSTVFCLVALVIVGAPVIVELLRAAFPAPRVKR